MYPRSPSVLIESRTTPDTAIRCRRALGGSGLQAALAEHAGPRGVREVSDLTAARDRRRSRGTSGAARSSVGQTLLTRAAGSAFRRPGTGKRRDEDKTARERGCREKSCAEQSVETKDQGPSMGSRPGEEGKDIVTGAERDACAAKVRSVCVVVVIGNDTLAWDTLALLLVARLCEFLITSSFCHRLYAVRMMAPIDRRAKTCRHHYGALRAQWHVVADHPFIHPHQPSFDQLDLSASCPFTPSHAPASSVARRNLCSFAAPRPRRAIHQVVGGSEGRGRSSKANALRQSYLGNKPIARVEQPVQRP